jgi:hypothetical protein
MSRPVALDIVLRAPRWVLLRDGADVREYGHADRALHEAVLIARELAESGEPAQVRIQDSHGRMIEVAVDPIRALDGSDERSAVTPGP